MQGNENLKKICGSELKGMKVEELTEVFRVDEDGRRINSLGFFRNEDIAKGFRQQQVDPNWYRTVKKFVLTDGETGYVIGEEVELLDDEKAALEIREKALSKLTEEEKKILEL